MWRKGHNNNNLPSVGTKVIWLLIFASSIASSTTTGFTSVNSSEYIELDAPLFSAFACFIVPPFFLYGIPSVASVTEQKSDLL